MGKGNEKTTANHKESAVVHGHIFFLMCIFYVFWFFGRKACGTLASQPGLNVYTLHWKAES